MDKIGSKSSGSELVNSFQNSQLDNIRIEKGSENNERSGLISWNPNIRNSDIPNEDGSKGRDPFIGLAHEMGHSWDRLKRDNAEVNAPWYTVPTPTLPLSGKVFCAANFILVMSKSATVLIFI